MSYTGDEEKYEFIKDNGDGSDELTVLGPSNNFNNFVHNSIALSIVPLSYQWFCFRTFYWLVHNNGGL